MVFLSYWFLLFGDLDGMSVGIANNDGLPESRIRAREFNHSRGDEGGPKLSKILLGFRRADPHKPGLPVDEIVGVLFHWIRAAVARRQIFQELDSRTRSCVKRSDAQPRSEYVVQAFLLRTVVLAFAADLEAENIAIESQARICI